MANRLHTANKGLRYTRGTRHEHRPHNPRSPLSVTHSAEHAPPKRRTADVGEGGFRLSLRRTDPRLSTEASAGTGMGYSGGTATWGTISSRGYPTCPCRPHDAVVAVVDIDRPPRRSIIVDRSRRSILPETTAPEHRRAARIRSGWSGPGNGTVIATENRCIKQPHIGSCSRKIHSGEHTIETGPQVTHLSSSRLQRNVCYTSSPEEPESVAST